MSDIIEIKTLDLNNNDTSICPFCNAHVPERIGDTCIEVSVSPKEIYQIFPYNNMTPTNLDNYSYCSDCSDSSKNKSNNSELHIKYIRWPLLYKNFVSSL